MAINKEALRFFMMVVETRMAERNLEAADEYTRECVERLKGSLGLETELDDYIRKKLRVMKEKCTPEMMAALRELGYTEVPEVR